MTRMRGSSLVLSVGVMLLAACGAPAGVIRGRVVLDDPPPAPRRPNIDVDPALARLNPDGIEIRDVEIDVRGGLAGAFVRIEIPHSALPQEGVVRIETRKGRLSPPLVVLSPGQRLEWVNRDPVPHTLHASGARLLRPWSLRPPMDRDEAVFDEEAVGRPLRCDVHPWERAWACVQANPCWAVTGPDGTFEIDGVPLTARVLEVWHPAVERLQVSLGQGPNADPLELRVRLAKAVR